MILFLVGFMGSGKSTLGRELAFQLFSTPLYDTDRVVEVSFGLSVGNIFVRYGEEAFRKKEAELLRAIPGPGGIVVTGGGLPCHSGNMEWMLEHGQVIWLRTDPETVFHRLKNHEEREKRPLLQGKSDEELQRFIAEKMKEREPFYSRAQYRFNPAEESLENMMVRLGLPPYRPRQVKY